MNDIPQQIERLQALRDSGALSEEEFQSAKKQVLSGGDTEVPSQLKFGESAELFGFTEPTWCMVMHLSQLLLFVGGVGIAVPIVLWVISKDRSEMANRHGSTMMNWIISWFIYTTVAALLCLFFIGIPILIGLIILQVVFPVIAGIKANDGRSWSYPLAIRFFPES